MRAIRRISAVIIGFVFFIAGLLKLMDPVGAGLVVEEYLKFLHLGFLDPLSKSLGVCMAMLETVIGAALITGVWRKTTAIATLALTGFFTLLTLVLVIANPVMDCGCFGEAIHLTHFQTFIKNVVLLALWALAFLPLSKMEPTRKVKYVSFAIALASVLYFTVFSFRSIPLLDFMEYKPGTEFIEDENTFAIVDAEGEYADSLILAPRVLVASIYDVDKISDKEQERLEETLATATELGYETLVLATAGAGEIMDNYFADRKVLLTLNRSNGGVTLVSDGQVVAKWSENKLPSADKLSELAEKSQTEAVVSEYNGSRMKMQGFLLYVFAVMLLL